MKRAADVCKAPTSATSLLEREMWFATRIAERTVGRFECRIFTGTTDRAERALRARALILQFRLDGLKLFAGEPETFADRFAVIYGEPLIQTGAAA